MMRGSDLALRISTIARRLATLPIFPKWAEFASGQAGDEGIVCLDVFYPSPLLLIMPSWVKLRCRWNETSARDCNRTLESGMRVWTILWMSTDQVPKTYYFPCYFPTRSDIENGLSDLFMAQHFKMHSGQMMKHECTTFLTTTVDP